MYPIKQKLNTKPVVFIIQRSNLKCKPYISQLIVLFVYYFKLKLYFIIYQNGKCFIQIRYDRKNIH